MVMLNLLWLVPATHFGEHFSGFETVSRASLRQTSASCVDNFRENPSEFIPA